MSMGRKARGFSSWMAFTLRLLNETASRRLLSFSHFDRINVSWSVHIGSKDNPFHVGRKRHVRLELVIVPGQVHELFRLEMAGSWREKINPLAVPRRGHA